MDPVSQCFEAMQLANAPNSGVEGERIIVGIMRGVLVIHVLANAGIEKCGKVAGRKTASDTGMGQSVTKGSEFRFVWLPVYSGTVVYYEKQGRRTVGLAGIV